MSSPTRLRSTAASRAVDCGRDDIFAGTTDELMQRAPGTVGGVRDGFHDSPTWRSFLPDQLSFLRSVLT